MADVNDIWDDEKDAEIERLKARIEALERFPKATRVMPSVAGIATLRETCGTLEAMAYTPEEIKEAGALRVLLEMHDKLRALMEQTDE